MIDRRKFLKMASLFAVSGMAACRSESTSAPAIAPVAMPPKPAGPITKKLVLVHGRDQQGKDPVKLKAAWLDTLNRGGGALGKKLPAEVDVVLPFYGDTLARFSEAAEIPLTSEVHSRGGPQQDDFLRFQAEFADDIRRQAGVTDAQVNAEYGDNPHEKGPLNWAWVQAILRAIDKNGTGMNGKALEVFTRDVYLYTTRAGVRDEIDAIVAAALTEEPTTIVSHSLGTVVAYNVLRSDRRRLNVPLLVTVGSPLGVRAVRDQLRPLRSPHGVSAWFNAFDRTDVVSLYPLDRQNFPIDPAIENHDKVKNHTDNHHGIDGYLDDPVVAARILASVGV